jgi:large conductance mechanosensitive channel
MVRWPGAPWGGQRDSDNNNNNAPPATPAVAGPPPPPPPAAAASGSSSELARLGSRGASGAKQAAAELTRLGSRGAAGAKQAAAAAAAAAAAGGGSLLKAGRAGVKAGVGVGSAGAGCLGRCGGGFSDFFLRSSIVDMAVGVVLGFSFQHLIETLVSSWLTPLIGAIFGATDWAALTFTVNNSVFAYGEFINALLTFLLVVGASYCLVVAPLMRLMEFKNRKRFITRDCPFCVEEIPIGATRCKCCTSKLPPLTPEELERLAIVNPLAVVGTTLGAAADGVVGGVTRAARMPLSPTFGVGKKKGGDKGDKAAAATAVAAAAAATAAAAAAAAAVAAADDQVALDVRESDGDGGGGGGEDSDGSGDNDDNDDEAAPGADGDAAAAPVGAPTAGETEPGRSGGSGAAVRWRFL